MVERRAPRSTLVESERPRLLMGAAASRFFGAPSERVDLIGITGTSGKTTTSYILASIFEAAGMPAGIIGTIGIFIGGQENLQRTYHARVDRLRVRAGGRWSARACVTRRRKCRRLESPKGGSMR